MGKDQEEKQLKSDKSTDSKEYIKYLYKHRESITKTRIDLDNSFDKYLLTFATGSLYLSILFTKTLDKPFQMEYLLFFGWTAFVLSICMILVSILFSVKSYEEEEENVAKMIESEEAGQKVSDCKNHWNNQVEFTETAGVIGFIVGLITLAFFYLINII